MIFEIRDLWPQTLIELGNLSKYHPLVLFFSFFEKFGYKKALYIVSLLEHSKEYMISRGMEPKKFRYIPNGIALEEVSRNEALPESIIKLIPKNKFLVGYVGTLGIANALDYLMESALYLRDNKDIHFLLVGKGSEKEKLKKFVLEHNLKNVTFIDPIPKLQVQSILNQCSVLYIGWHRKKIYKYGISANKIFDYMYAQKPIIHGFEFKNNIVNKAKCGITIQPKNSIAIKDAILELKNKSKEELYSMGVSAKEYVINNHSYDKLALKYKELF
jgi:glycosyltransferase involved in cell wall biosynthesis